MTVVGCDEADSPAETADVAEEVQAAEAAPSEAEAKLAEYLESGDEDSEEFPCDPLVNQPDEEIDYKIRALILPETDEPVAGVIDPGDDWCKSSDRIFI